ncbi:Diphthamide biosynthesis protein 1 [Wickerhamomyces ciferrii]|uniref:2-(3-amino-3-carboxypropyl)histidine synthase subunit 1 n=1 Tax=Wickerhamomyces ciferrii (strain ATCC 14091 / BCRC 22168 / CBS 111 / JCM 3599 / NBRC 0793 / NRRL Y-1031 F-60-10) TaxID=1206466 RepID=K0KKU3_WICCF|nr:Diphthamide biosynthesis protein 1 [Wickerhamomyces ciferrii]CCH43631.1 Diphthamide biosynthesis protein 1 [Wickerhamomyces ciferrii]
MSEVEVKPSAQPETEVKRVPRKRFVGKRGPGATNADASRVKGHVGRVMTQVPQEILEDKELNEAIKLLPSNYNFEIHKTVWNIKKQNAKRVALQMPEGLLIYSLIISDILEQFCGVETIVMGDVSYGACCIDDFTARSLNCDFIVHYAHSCLVPIDITLIKVLYIFVTINIDETHLIKTIQRNFPSNSKIATFGTIQFNPTIHAIKDKLANNEEHPIYTIPPQIMPLSKGEVLGCTSQRLDKEDIDAMIYVGDGRFHLESAMIHNPEIPAYRYDPYSRKFTREYYDQKQLIKIRHDAIQTASKAKKIGLILGALGRQGNINTLANLESNLSKRGIIVVKIILSEIFPQKLSMFDDIDAFIQVACPRLSIDWGYAFNKPLLTPYEANVMMEMDKMWNENYYPMDYYGKDGYGRGKIPDHSSINV